MCIRDSYHAVQEIFFTQNYSWMEYQQQNPSGTRLSPVILYDNVNRAPQYLSLIHISTVALPTPGTTARSA